MESWSDKYQIIRQIGKGSSGEVFLAQRSNESADSEVFVMKQLKVMKRRHVLNALGEVTVHSAITHPFIVRHIESFVDQDVVVIIMEYCSHGDLSKVLKQQRGARKRLKESVVLEMFAQICLAVDHLHEHRILHRDIKLQNLFVTDDNRIQLGDFGIAKILSEDEMTSSRVGTPYFMAPELVGGEGYSYKAEVWALGCVLYELCTLKHAFNCRNFRELETAFQKPVPEVPQGKGFSDDLIKLVASMLQFDPDERPTIAEVLDLPLMDKAVARVRKKYMDEASKSKSASGGDSSYTGSASDTSDYSTSRGQSTTTSEISSSDDEDLGERAYDVLVKMLEGIDKASAKRKGQKYRRAVSMDLSDAVGIIPTKNTPSPSPMGGPRSVRSIQRQRSEGGAPRRRQSMGGIPPSGRRMQSHAPSRGRTPSASPEKRKTRPPSGKPPRPSTPVDPGETKDSGDKDIAHLVGLRELRAAYAESRGT